MKAFNNPAEILNSTSLVDTFLELVKIDTQSDPKSETMPSAAKELDGLQAVKARLDALGISDAAIDENGYLFATLPGNVENAPTIGLIAHIDTAPDYSGTNVQPILHENYQGNAIELKDGWTMDADYNPELKQCIGDTLITSDGTTLLGADDKAGVAEILAAVEFLLAHPEIERPTLRIGITPDEEIGKGASKFDVDAFGARCAYTLDGGFSGEINGETFSADGAVVTFTGVMVHPGMAKDKLVNALRWASTFVTMLPADEAPETTEHRKGFYHPVEISGGSAEAKVELILRDFDDEILATRGEKLKEIAAKLIEQEPRLKIDVDVKLQYRNMANGLRELPQAMENLKQAVQMADIEPRIDPIRGGTDGSGLTAKGLPCPNIFAGGLNFHGPREWVSTRVMGQAVCTVLNLLQLWSQEK